MAPAGTITEAPRVNLFDGTGIVADGDEGVQLGELHALGWPDKISDEIGRPGYIEGYVLDGCLVPAEDNREREPAVFDRYYYTDDGHAPVLVDVLSGGSDLDCEMQEAEKHVALKRKWCKARGMTYKVVVAMPSPVPLG